MSMFDADSGLYCKVWLAVEVHAVRVSIGEDDVQPTASMRRVVGHTRRRQGRSLPYMWDAQHSHTIFH